MLTVEKIWEGLRQEGLNYGLPTTFIKLGEGREFPSMMELVREILFKTKCKWICLLGEGTTQVGMGTLVKSLSTVGQYVEVECDGSIRDPGWSRAVDRWVIDYSPEPLFNYAVLRPADMMRFTVRSEKDLPALQSGFEALKFFAGTKYVRMTDRLPSVFEFVRKYDRSRIYYVKE